MTRRFPDAAAVLLDVIADLVGGPDATGTVAPADLRDRALFVRAVRVGGPDDGVTDLARVDVDVFAPTAKAARDAAEEIRERLTAPGPRRAGTVVLDRVTTDVGPRELPWGDGIRRWGASYAVLARRATVTA